MVHGSAPSPEPAPDDPQGLTSFHVRRATAGDAGSRSWVVERLTPFLILQAEVRMPATLRRHLDPEDLVAETWVAALPKLDAIAPQDGRYTPVLLTFLGKILLYKVNNRIRKHIIGKPGVVPVREGSGSSDGSSGAVLAAEVTDVIRRAERREATAKVLECLRALDPAGREIILLRCLEGLTLKQVGAHLGIQPSAAQMRYARALERLRGLMPGSVFDELED